MTWDTQTSVIAVGAVALVSLLLGLVLLVRTGRMRQQYRVLDAADGRESFVEVVARKAEEVEALRDDVATLAASIRATQSEVNRAIRHVGLVRYDAFGDMGGRMSFSVALVDDFGNGFILTTVHARSESRTYIKEIRGGMAEVTLSPEESQALEDAISQTPGSRP
ncbi:MAG: DUF4446 family protein [Actinomycetota bacterium]